MNALFQKDTSYRSLEIGKPILLGKLSLSETEIIEYAKAFDPLDFHVSKEAAKKSMFGELVASGPHIFQAMHFKFWIPLFGNSVLAGLEVNHWKFLKPVFANREVECYVTILSRKVNSDGKSVTIKWFYEFKYTGEQELIQSMETTILHKA